MLRALYLALFAIKLTQDKQTAPVAKKFLMFFAIFFIIFAIPLIGFLVVGFTAH